MNVGDEYPPPGTTPPGMPNHFAMRPPGWCAVNGHTWKPYGSNGRWQVCDVCGVIDPPAPRHFASETNYGRPGR